MLQASCWHGILTATRWVSGPGGPGWLPTKTGLHYTNSSKRFQTNLKIINFRLWGLYTRTMKSFDKNLIIFVFLIYIFQKSLLFWNFYLLPPKGPKTKIYAKDVKNHLSCICSLKFHQSNAFFWRLPFFLAQLNVDRVLIKEIDCNTFLFYKYVLKISRSDLIKTVKRKSKFYTSNIVPPGSGWQSIG